MGDAAKGPTVTPGARSLPGNCFEPVGFNPVLGVIAGRRRFTSCRLSLLRGDCGGGLADYVEHGARLGDHRNVAALHLDGRGAHALRGEAFQVGLDGAILGGYDGPTWLRPPSNAIQLLGEQIEGWREVGRIDDALLFGRQIAGEARDAGARIQPNAAVGDVNVLKTSVMGNFSCSLCDVSVSSGPKAAM